MRGRLHCCLYLPHYAFQTACAILIHILQYAGPSRWELHKKVLPARKITVKQNSFLSPSFCQESSFEINPWSWSPIQIEIHLPSSRVYLFAKQKQARKKEEKFEKVDPIAIGRRREVVVVGLCRIAFGRVSLRTFRVWYKSFPRYDLFQEWNFLAIYSIKVGKTGHSFLFILQLWSKEGSKMLSPLVILQGTLSFKAGVVLLRMQSRDLKNLRLFCSQVCYLSYAEHIIKIYHHSSAGFPLKLKDSLIERSSSFPV